MTSAGTAKASSRTTRPTTAAGLAADAVALLDHLGSGAGVFSYSMGTRTAMQMAIDAPDRGTT